MAADVITRFKLETTQFDSKLRDTAKQLQSIARQAEKAGKDFSGFDKGAIEAARALGTVASGATNAKDKLRDLVGSFNDAAKAYNSLSEEAKKGEFGKAMAASLQKLQLDIKKTKEELYGLSGKSGGLFSGDKISGMLQVFGGNLMTKAAGMAAGFATELGDAVKHGVELAKQGEGIRIAFERLGRGDILQGLREATHGTVTDLELMKAAVKFNDFKLPLEELGTMLAFAQQKAKDTGQSVDYMVDSIVTGLGRKSLMILDNLGLSANEVKEKMKETGDMTKAVGEIIREQMAKAGDYVETAADRAAQANVSLQNKMEELGRKFAPVEEASSQLWTSMKIGILDIIGGPLATLINQLTEAGRLKNALNDINGTGSNTKLDRMLGNLRNAGSGNRQSIFQQQQAEIWRYINSRENYLKDRGSWVNTRDEGLRQSLVAREKSFGTSNVNDIKAQIGAAKQLLADYKAGAKDILNPVAAISSAITGGDKSGKGGSTGPSMPKNIRWDNYADKATIGADALKGSDDANFLSPYAMMLDDIKAKILDVKDADLGSALEIPDVYKQKMDEYAKGVAALKSSISTTASLVGTIGQAFGAIEDPAAKVASIVAQAIANIALAYSDALAKDTTSKFNIFGFIAASAASMVSMATAIAQVHSATGYAEGGIVKGNSYSGDNMMFGGDGLYGLNAGELVLTKAQQGSLAQSLQNGGGQTVRVVGRLRGKDIFLSAENWSKSAGHGEFLTW